MSIYDFLEDLDVPLDDLTGPLEDPLPSTSEPTTPFMPIYTYANIQSAVNRRLHNKLGLMTDPRSSINDAVRELLLLMDIRSAKRRAQLAPNLFEDVFSYGCPADMKGVAIVDLQRQTDDRPRQEDFTLVGEQQFDQRKSLREGLVAFTDRDFTRKLLISTRIDDQTLIVDSLDSTVSSSSTSWTGVGDATNLRTDNQNYVKGDGAIEFDLNAGQTTAGIQNTNLEIFDLTNYIGNGSVFVWVYIVTADANITGVTLKLGNNTSNYFTRTVTTTNEGLAFQQGWNLLRFDLNGITQVGTVTLNTCSFASVYLNKLNTKLAETSYRFDNIMVKNGRFYNLIYYSKYPWQTATGTYIENSTADTDLLNLDTDEYQLAVEKAVELCGMETEDANDVELATTRFAALSKKYTQNHPSEAITWTESYYDLASIDGDDRMDYGVTS
jgi:hypothetical protein